VVDLGWHFEGRDALGEVAFAWLEEVLEGRAVTVLPLKTFISFVARSNFAFLRVKKQGVEISLVLDRAVDHPRLARVDAYGGKKSFYRFRFSEAGELDEGLRELVLEAYDGGRG
jgi:hypothetical protein